MHADGSRLQNPVVITGRDLDPVALSAIARGGATVVVAAAGRERMQAANAVVRRAAESDRPVYGVTTGLGSRATESVHDADGAEFSLRTIRGRATAVGQPLSREVVRAAMAVRLNGLCAGGAGAAPRVADALADLLNHRVHPEVPRSGSIGAADLCLMAHVGLGLIGEGRAELDGEWMDAAEALTRAGLAPVVLGPKDGLAICSNSSVAIGVAALVLADGEAALGALQIATALSMEGFRANLSPLDPRAVAARPAPGQAWSAQGLRTLLHSGSLKRTAPDDARRVQDPLSYRCASQLNGALRAALDHLAEALEPDLNGAADNPLVLPDDEEILSTGNFQAPALALALDAAAIAIAQVAHGGAERQSRLKTSALSGLSRNLVPDGTTRSGVAPLSKTAHALVLEIRHLAAPLAIHAMVTADGVEDDSTGATQAALRMAEQLARLRSLIAIELLVAAQAVDVAGVGPELGQGTLAAQRCVREVVPTLGEDRPLGREVTRLEQAVLDSGSLAARVSAATASAASAGVA